MSTELSLLSPSPSSATSSRSLATSPTNSHRGQRALEAAGLDSCDASSCDCDSHRLTHAFITALARSGAAVEQAQAPARRSNPALTFRVYTHVGLDELRDALDAMPATLGKARSKCAERPCSLPGQRPRQASRRLRVVIWRNGTGDRSRMIRLPWN